MASLNPSTSNPWVDGQTYEHYVGRWSRIVAAEFLSWLRVPKNSTWLDVGCGTGALTQLILARCAPFRVHACDLSAAFIEFARRSISDSRVSFGAADACKLPQESAAYDATVCGLLLPALTDQAGALLELVRVAKVGGIVGTYLWDFGGEMQMLRYFWEAATALDPRADEPDDDDRFAICKPDRLAAALRNAGLHNVDARAIDAPTRFGSFEDYWTPFLSGHAPAQEHVQSLSEERRSALRSHLQAVLPIAGDGSISLIARAWAAKGYK